MLGLTDHEEDLIVTFLQTLTDGFATPYPDINPDFRFPSGLPT